MSRAPAICDIFTPAGGGVSGPFGIVPIGPQHSTVWSSRIPHPVHGVFGSICRNVPGTGDHTTSAGEPQHAAVWSLRSAHACVHAVATDAYVPGGLPPTSD